MYLGVLCFLCLPSAPSGPAVRHRILVYTMAAVKSLEQNTHTYRHTYTGMEGKLI